MSLMVLCQSICMLLANQAGSSAAAGRENDSEASPNVKSSGSRQGECEPAGLTGRFLDADCDLAQVVGAPRREVAGERAGKPFGQPLRRRVVDRQRDDVAGGNDITQITKRHFVRIGVSSYRKLAGLLLQEELVVQALADGGSGMLELAEVDHPGVGSEVAAHLHEDVVVVAMQRLTLAAERREMRRSKTQGVAL